MTLGAPHGPCEAGRARHPPRAVAVGCSRCQIRQLRGMTFWPCGVWPVPVASERSGGPRLLGGRGRSRARRRRRSYGCERSFCSRFGAELPHRYRRPEGDKFAWGTLVALPVTLVRGWSGC